MRTQWKKVEDELPKDNRMVFVCKAGGFIDDSNYYGAVVYADKKFGKHEFKATHWMYPPKLYNGQDIDENA